MELGTVRKLRYFLLAAVCVFCTLTLTYIYPDVIPHRVRQVSQMIQYIPYRPPLPFNRHANTQTSTPNPSTITQQNLSQSKRRLTIINYTEYPIDNQIECVPLKTGAPTTKICIHPVSKDQHVSGQLKRSGTWEAHIVIAVKNQLQKCPDCGFIDIGANIGVFGISVASTTGRKVIAVEPLKANKDRLVKAIKINGLENTVTVVANPVSNVYENVSFWQPKDNAGGTHSASQNVTDFDRKIFEKAVDQPVPTIKLDDLVEVCDFKKAVMKIDIEGYEPRAFLSADKLFNAIDIHYIFMEWGGKGKSKGEAAEYVKSMITFMNRHGFKGYDNNLRPLKNTDNSELTFQKTGVWPWDIVWVRP